MRFLYKPCLTLNPPITSGLFSYSASFYPATSVNNVNIQWAAIAATMPPQV